MNFYKSTLGNSLNNYKNWAAAAERLTIGNDVGDGWGHEGTPKDQRL